MQTKVIEIKDIKVGDMIKSYEDNKVVYKRVTNVWDTVVEHDQQIELVFTNGTTLSCSTDHPIMCLIGDTIAEKLPLELSTYDMVLCDSGITFLDEVKRPTNPIGYIDIEVEDTHVFYAATSGTDMVLTHNCSQGGIRKGSATCYWPLWHLECENLMVLKNNKGIEENRIRHMDYGIQINNLMIERYLMDEYITLFSPDVLNGRLLDAYYRDEDEFRRLYTLLESDPSIRKKRIKATEVFMGLFMTERANTSRLYPQHVDNTNNYGPWIRKIAPVKMSNLCAEIALHTVPMASKRMVKVKMKKSDIKRFIETYGTNGVVLPTNTPGYKD